MLTKYTTGNILINFNSGKLLPEQNTLDCLSILSQMLSWCHDDSFCFQRLAWVLFL